MNFKFLIARFFRSARHLLNLGVTQLHCIPEYFNIFFVMGNSALWTFYLRIQIGPRVPTLASFINKNGLMDLMLPMLHRLRPLHRGFLELNAFHHMYFFSRS